mmetsp:Transcript_944/g.1208  ORF Transcript_944/g.1208 Transcript_944/m.1208 type:complete len:231 (+) Transcript_944:418-1110(+)
MSATVCSSLQHPRRFSCRRGGDLSLQHTATVRSALQQSTTLCNTLRDLDVVEVEIRVAVVACRRCGSVGVVIGGGVLLLRGRLLHELIHFRCHLVHFVLLLLGIFASRESSLAGINSSIRGIIAPLIVPRVVLLLLFVFLFVRLFLFFLFILLVLVVAVLRRRIALTIFILLLLLLLLILLLLLLTVLLIIILVPFLLLLLLLLLALFLLALFCLLRLGIRRLLLLPLLG